MVSGRCVAWSEVVNWAIVQWSMVIFNRWLVYLKLGFKDKVNRNQDPPTPNLIRWFQFGGYQTAPPPPRKLDSSRCSLGETTAPGCYKLMPWTCYAMRPPSYTRWFTSTTYLMRSILHPCIYILCLIYQNLCQFCLLPLKVCHFYYLFTYDEFTHGIFFTI